MVRTTPGQFGLMTIMLMIVCVVFGLTAAAGLQQRQDALDDLVTSSEPLAVAAQEVYRSLSDADATAASGFLEGGVEPPAVRQRYQDDLARAGAALAAAAGAAGGSPEAARSVAELSTYLPVYAGLVETARANNRAGLPVGAAYLREASGLMRGTLLPAAQRLYDGESDRLAATESRATPVPWFEVLLGLGALGALLGAQVLLFSRTRRVLNVGLVAATVAVALGLGWLVYATTAVTVNVADARDLGSSQVRELATARIAALEARGDETLTLVVRGSGQQYEEHHVEVMTRLGGENGDGGLLGAALDGIDDAERRPLVADAVERWRAWRTAHTEIRRLDDGGDYPGAVALAIEDRPDGALAPFTALERDLADAIAVSGRLFDEEAADARSALGWTSAGILVLVALAVAGVGWGMWQRLKEYR
ncbi:MAG TPA: hypothetical protein VGD67_23525 [Pseudonocardiaceae bacterium]